MLSLALNLILFKFVYKLYTTINKIIEATYIIFGAVYRLKIIAKISFIIN